MAGWFKQEPLPDERDAQGFPVPGEIDADILAAAAKAGEDEINELLLEVVTSADAQSEELGATQKKTTAAPPLEARRTAPVVNERPVDVPAPGGIFRTPGGIFAEPTLPRETGQPAIDPTIPGPPPISADPSGWPETWVPGDSGGTSDVARPLFTTDQLRAALRTPKYLYGVPESRTICRTCRHCWSGYAVAPVRSQSTTFFAQFRRCMAFPRFMIDLTEAQVVSCSMHAPGGAPASKPPELAARDRARGIEDE